MATRFQNRVAGSRMTLPATIIYGIAVWLAAGLAEGGMWIQFACFALAAYLMVGLNNSSSLIRVYSGMVPSMFIALTCSATFTLPSVDCAVTQLCTVTTVALLFSCYQDKMSTGHTFYAFVSLGISSLFCIQMLYYVPVAWIIMAFFVRSLSWRTVSASVLGLCLPYWIAVPIALYTGQMETLADHLSQIASPYPLADFSRLTVSQMATAGLLAALCITGIVHCQRQRIEDKIRTRMFNNSLATLSIASAALAVAQPQLFDTALRIMVIGTGPLIAHFMTLTKTKITNIAFFIIVAATIILTAFNLWMP